MISSLRRKCLLIVLIAVLLMQVFTLASLAAEFEEFNKVMDEQEQKPEESHNLWLDLLKLVLILGLIVGATWSLVKVFSKQLGKKMQGTWLQVVDEVALGQNRGIVLCEISCNLCTCSSIIKRKSFRSGFEGFNFFNKREILSLISCLVEASFSISSSF